jgi:homospermidine synthase
MVHAQGQLAGEFHGFNDTDTVFEFFGGGSKWQQAEYRYEYHYAYMPSAKVVQEGSRYILYVQGVSSPIEVRRVW